MNKTKKIVLLFTLFLTVLQVIYYCSYSFSSEKKVTTFVNTNQNNEILLKDLNKELKAIGNIKINAQSKSQNKWYSNITIMGKRDEIEKTINLLTDFNILEYNIDGNFDNLNVNLDIVQ